MTLYTPRTNIETLPAEVSRVFSSLPSEAILSHTHAQQQMIRKVIALYLCSFQYFDKQYCAKHIVGTKPDGSPLYIQHSPSVADGLDSIFDFGELASKQAAELWGKPNERPVPEFDFKRIFVDGDFVICHLLATRFPGDRGWNCVDIFRLTWNDQGQKKNSAGGDDDGLRVVEHWESISEVLPDEAFKHSNTQF